MHMTGAQDTPYRLGLDIGTNSIGWAALCLNHAGDPYGVLGMGVRVFPDGRDAKSKESSAKTRRLARGARRRRDRYTKRRADLLKKLVAWGLMPQLARERRALAARHDPYELRARALDDPLGPHELGRVLFHLNQRRGFKSNRKAEQDGNESGVIKQAAEALEDQMAESDARTLGELLDYQRREGKPTRFRNLGTGTTAQYEFFPTRQMLLDEFDLIRDTQQPRHDLSPDQWDDLRNRIIFYQRPLKPVDPGWCQFEAGEPRAARALPVAQEFRMLQEVNNLRLRVGVEPARRLNADERLRALERLRSGRDINLAKPTKDLRLPSQATFNLARGGRNIVRGDATAARLVKEKGRSGQSLFGAGWLKRPLDARNDIVRAILDTDDPDDVQARALADWGLDSRQAKAVAAIGLPPGFASLSEAAIRKLLPHLEQGLVFSDAVQAAGYQHHSVYHGDKAHDSLPYYGVVLERDAIGADPTKDPVTDGDVARYGRFPHPTVHIGLNQLRRVVNRLIQVYGKPEEIVVELARDLKANRERRQWWRQQQRIGRERNERFEELLSSVGEENTPEIRRKLRLWEEQGPPQARCCPYTGRPISFAMAVDSRTEIDHILPFSRTLNDSPANKVVCLAAANRDKGDRSPHEAFGHNPPGYDYDEMLARAAALPDNKRWRFEPDAMEKFEQDRDFMDRQLNETSYLSRTACRYLAHLYDEKTEGRRRVRAVPGHMTAVLRRGWGLEGMLRVSPAGEIVRKQRDDHRHHAIDAFVVASTTQGLLQRFAHASRSRRREAAERLAAIAKDVPPWEGFSREALRSSLRGLVVSHKLDHGTRGHHGRTTGQLHNETAFGLVRLSETHASQVVVRKRLAALKRGDLVPISNGQTSRGVRDLALRAALLELWDRVGGKAQDFAQHAASHGVLVNGRPQLVRRVRVVGKETVIPVSDRDGRAYKGYKSDGNEFVDVWEVRTRQDRSGTWQSAWRLVAVPTFHANQPDFDVENFRPSVSRGAFKGRPDPTAKLLIRIHRGDMGALGTGDDRRIVCVRKFGNGYVVLDDHHEADVDGRERRGDIERNNGLRATRLRELGFRKVRVDEIGRVLDPGPP